MKKHPGLLAGLFFLCGLLSLLPDRAFAAVFDVANPAQFQAALIATQGNGEDDTINVAAGTYNIPSTLTFSTDENYSVTIAGAGAETTILDGGGACQILAMAGTGNGDIFIRDLTFRNGRMSAGATPIGGGLALTNGRNGSITVERCVIADNTSSMHGGGIYVGILNGTATISDCVVRNNSTDPGTGDDAGGIDVYVDTGGTGSFVLRNSTVTDNTLGDNTHSIGGCDGAGVFFYHLGAGGSLTVENNVIRNNVSHYGVGGFFARIPNDATIVFTGNTISGNTSGGSSSSPEILGGGALLHMERGSMTVSGNKFIQNHVVGAYTDGGGLALELFTSGTVDLVSNVFSGNTSGRNGGGATVLVGSGVSRTQIIENLFVNNEADGAAGSGGGLNISSEASEVNLVNNTYYGNSASGGGGVAFYGEGAGRALNLHNEVVWSNTPDSLANLGTGTMAARYSNIQGGTGQSWFGAGCIDTDPLFSDASNPPGPDGIFATPDDGLHPASGSPCANTGNSTYVPGTVTTDIAGQARIQGGTVDMGAYEGAAAAPVAYQLTLGAVPAGSGTTTPPTGTHTLTSPRTIAATPAAGFYFVNWTGSLGVTIENGESATTTAYFTGASSIDANFAVIPATATLTIAISPAGAGITAPTAGPHTVNTQEQVSIEAVANPNYTFSNWSFAGNIAIGNTGSAGTTATLLSDSTATANFVSIPFMTYGAFRRLTPADLTGFSGTAFGGKPSAFVEYDDVVSGARKRPALATVFDTGSPRSFDSILNKKIPLLDKRNIEPSQTAAVYIPLVQTVNLPFYADLSVRATDGNTHRGTYSAGQVRVVPPEITGVYKDDWTTPIAKARAGALIYIEGRYFGTTAPSVWLEYQVRKGTGVQVLSRRATVMKPLQYPDYRGVAGKSCMNLHSDTGLSRIVVKMPLSFPANWDEVSTEHNIVIDNGIGRATIDFKTGG